MANKKNLSLEESYDASIIEDYLNKTNGYRKPGNYFSIHEVPVKVKCLNEKQKLLKRSIEEKDITISIGPAGTGRTYMSLLTGLHLLKTEPRYRKLVLVKSLQTISGESLGYLPGNVWEKMEPYMYSFTGNLDKIFGSTTTTRKLIENETIKVLPIAYVRGVTIDNAIVIIDEAQNIDTHTFKTIITRIGRNCKMIFLGDTDQIDRKNRAESCLSKVAKLFESYDGVGTVVFTKEESVRHPIIPKLLDMLEDVE